MKLKKYLVVRADGECRIVNGTRGLHLRLDEFAYRLNVTIPDLWASVVGDIDIVLPPPDVDPSVTIDPSS